MLSDRDGMLLRSPMKSCAKSRASPRSYKRSMERNTRSLYVREPSKVPIAAKGAQSLASNGALTRLRHWKTLPKNADEMGIPHDLGNRWRMKHEWDTACSGSAS